MNEKMSGSTAGLDALGMVLMVKKESVIMVNMITEVMTSCVLILLDLKCMETDTKCRKRMLAPITTRK